MGLRYVNDFNGEVQQGIGYYQTTTRNGERASTAQTYLASVRDDAKLKVVTGALAHRIRTDAGVRSRSNSAKAATRPCRCACATRSS